MVHECTSSSELKKGWCEISQVKQYERTPLFVDSGQETCSISVLCCGTCVQC